MSLKSAILVLSLGILVAPLGAIEPLTPIAFDLGVDFARLCTEIDDRGACDSSNMYGDRVGSAGTRFGSHLINEIAVSTNPFSSLFSATIATSNIQINILIGVSGNTIYYSTQDTVSSWSILYRGLSTPNQRFTFAVAQNLIFMTGNALTDPVFKFDVAASSFSPALLSFSTATAVIYAKYLLWEKGYMLYGNVRDVRNGLAISTTYYDDRVYYSFELQPSSVTVDRFLNITPGDGEYITGLTSKRSSSVGTSIVEVYKKSSISSISFIRLNPAGEGGDQSVARIAYGFGHVGDSPPENIGSWDVMLSQSGILQWNGGLLTRANLEAERVVISNKIKPLIDKLIRRNTYAKSILKHYPKSNYLIFAYEDPDLFPRNALNSSMFYDLVTGEWWPMKNFIIGSIETDNGPNGTGKIMYGDGMDGYAHFADDPLDSDDSPKQISLEAMETLDGWKNAGISNTVAVVGTASVSLTLSPSVLYSSITKNFVMPMGEWYDKSQSSGTDKFSFKVYPSSIGFLTSLRVDLLVQDVQGHFDENFSSVTLSSAALTAGSSAWTTIDIAFSSFPLRNEWTNFETESVPFARNSTRFGLRFVATATADLTLYFDDVRFKQATNNPLNPFRLTKQFNFGTMAEKDFKQIVVLREKQRDSTFNIDVLTGQGQLANSITVPRDIPQEIFVCGLSSIPGISKMSSIDFSIIGGTRSLQNFSGSLRLPFDFENGAADKNYIYAFDSFGNKLVKIDRSSMTVFVSTYGSLGTGTTSFNYIQEIAVETPEKGNLLIVDHMNHRLKEHRKSDLSFVRQYGQLGNQATSFYNVTGVDWDARSIYVGDDGNQRIVRMDREYIVQAQAKLDINTIGNVSVRVGPRFLYCAYNRGSNNQVFFIDVVLEKRNKSDLSLISRKTLRPTTTTVASTYTIRGSIALHSKYLIVTFNDGALDAGNFYIQKLLQSDFSVVLEKVFSVPNFGLIGDNLSRETEQKTEKINLEVLPNSYVQLRFYSKDELDTSFKLSNMAFVVEKKEYIQ